MLPGCLVKRTIRGWMWLRFLSCRLCGLWKPFFISLTLTMQSRRQSESSNRKYDDQNDVSSAALQDVKIETSETCSHYGHPLFGNLAVSTRNTSEHHTVHLLIGERLNRDFPFNESNLLADSHGREPEQQGGEVAKYRVTRLKCQQKTNESTSLVQSSLQAGAFSKCEYH